jgi:hypothetical protein
MIAFSVVSRSGELFPGVPQGKLSLSFPWGIPYLFSYENKARNLFQGLRARYRAHLKFARAQVVPVQSPVGVVKP